MKRYSELNQERSELEDVVPLAKPYVLFIEPSSLCNYHCVQCFQSLDIDGYFHNNRRNLDFSLYQEILKQLQTWEGGPLRSLRLSLFGEPLLNPSFAEMARLAHQSGVAERIETTTNLSLLTPETARKIVESGIDYIRVSVYAVDPERHRAVTGTAIQPNDILQKVSLLREAREQLRSKTPYIAVKMFRTYDDEEALFLKMYQGIADEAYLDILHNWTSEKDFVGDFYRSDADKAREDIANYQDGKMICPYCFYSMAVKSTGDVGVCCADWSGATNLLNIKDHTLRQIWNSREMYEFRKMQLEGRKDENAGCKGCTQCASSYYCLSSAEGIDINRFSVDQ